MSDGENTNEPSLTLAELEPLATALGVLITLLPITQDLATELNRAAVAAGKKQFNPQDVQCLIDALGVGLEFVKAEIAETKEAMEKDQIRLPLQGDEEESA